MEGQAQLALRRASQRAIDGFGQRALRLLWLAPLSARQGLRLDSASVPSAWHMERLGEAAHAAAETLRTAKQLGTVVLLTNAERGWIELSCQKFAPALLPIIENVKIVSARTRGPARASASRLRKCLGRPCHPSPMFVHSGAGAIALPPRRRNREIYLVRPAWKPHLGRMLWFSWEIVVPHLQLTIAHVRKARSVVPRQL